MENQATSSDLEQFRQQWQQEVQQRSKKSADNKSHGEEPRNQTNLRAKPERPVHKPPTKHPLADATELEEQHDAKPNQASPSSETKLERLESLDLDDDGFTAKAAIEPQSALEHFEKAVEKEIHGNLSESLSHYRKAYRLDAKVDQEYKNKHFAQQWKQSKPNPPNAAPTVPSTAHHSLAGSGNDAAAAPSSSAKPVVVSDTAELISSFANEEIPNAEPIIEGDIPPPCPIRHLPTEVLLELLRHVALFDISIYTRLASVCKKLAYHVHTEASIWKRVALGPEVGLASQLYHFATDVQGREAIWQALDDDDDDEKPMPVVSDDHFTSEQDWREVLHSYPRIRFSGVYISTVNYTRSGGAASSWGNQIHVVTYYRYLRFFRDGTCISLLTTHEPTEVVNLLTKENVALVRSGKELLNPLNFASNAPASLQHNAGKGKSDVPGPPPSAQNIMKHALRGRWRLCHPSLSDIEIGSNSGAPGDLHIETEGGAGPRYMYTMHLSLKHGNSRNKHATKNNKLVWKGFWSYNALTHDWAEFHLRNDKAFWFSRVKSYGMGY